MEVFRFSILPMADIERRQAFKEAINNCPHCDHVMRFEYTVDYMDYNIEEEAFCAHCKSKVRQEKHRIQ